VQLTMQVIAIFRGNRHRPIQLIGLALAIGGLFWLLGPGAEPPPLGAALLMAVSGAAWGVYSSLGLTGGDPARATARNFLFAAPLSLTALLFLPIQISAYGVGLAVMAGAITSALGYVIWYMALPGLSATTAGVAQLLVPSIAAIGGMIFLSETVSSRLLFATALIILGIVLTIWKGKKTR
jgi:drug/metabolite transporter (DMT)-like permease